MKLKIPTGQFQRALVVFVVAGLLATVLLASFSTGAPIAYGQTAGPTNTPVAAPATATIIPTNTPVPATTTGTTAPATTVPGPTAPATTSGITPTPDPGSTPTPDPGIPTPVPATPVPATPVSGGPTPTPTAQVGAVTATPSGPGNTPRVGSGGVVPGLPNTGVGQSGNQNQPDQTWKMIALAALSLVMGWSLLVMRRNRRRNR